MPTDYDSMIARAADPASTTSDGADSMPSYMQASDNHNYGNGNFAVTDPSTWGTGLGNAGKFIVSAAASGLNSFYNTGVTVGNWLGADLKENDVATQLAAVDDDLGAYYKQNRESADLAGFVLTSIIPGMAGVKLLNAGQKVLRAAAETGMIGSNLSKVTGLLAPSVPAYRALAATEIAQSGATFSALSGNTLKALGAGYGQAALESAAFEIAVSATSFKSPTLSDADGWDIGKNMLVGTVTGGVIGGAINHAISYGAIKGAAKTLNPAEKLFTDTSDIVGLSPAQSIIARGNKLSGMPAAPTGKQIASGEFQGAETLLKGLTPVEREVAAGNLATKFERMRTEAQTSMQLRNRGDFHALTKGDKELGNQLADFSFDLNSNDLAHNLEHLTSFGRIGTELSEEKQLTKLAQNAVKTGTEPEVPFKIGYIKLSGEGSGAISFDAPKITGLADIFGDKESVLREVNKFKFSDKKVWQATEAAASDTGHYEAEARYIWADSLPPLKNGAVIGERDIPLLEKAITDKVDNLFIAPVDGSEVYPIMSAQDIYKHTTLAKQEAALDLLKGSSAGTGKTTEEIAKIINVRTSYLEGELSTNPTTDLFARQGYKSEYVTALEKKGIYTTEREQNFPFQPTYAKAAYDTKGIEVDGMQLAGMAYMKAQQKLYQQGIDNVVAHNVPAELFNRFYHPGDDVMLEANRFGGGARLLTSANGGYGTVESWTEAMGSATSALQKHFKDSSTDALQSVLFKVASKQEVAIEWESINKTLQSTAENYGINEAGTALEPLKLLDYNAKLAAGEKNIIPPSLQEGAPITIPIKSTDTLELLNARTQLTANRTQAIQEIRNAQGLEDMKDVRAVRPVRLDPKEYPFYAVVVDPTITGVGHKSMIHATSARDLETLITKVPGQYKVYKGDELKQFFKNNGEFDWEMTLHENYIDSDLKRNGINNPFFIKTDPQKIAQGILQDHLRSDDIFARELVNAKYEKEFTFLRQQGDQYISTQTSKYTSSIKDLEASGDNPYTNYIKTALNISQGSHYPTYQALNTKLDSVVSEGVRKISDAFSGTKVPADLDGVNKLLNEFGVKSGYYDAATQLIANHTAPKGDLVKFVSRANSILSSLVTRSDPLNAINNAVGSTVLYGTELKSFMNAMGSDDSVLVGKLHGLLSTPVPGARMGAEGADSMLTAGKVFLNAVKNFTDPEAKTLSGMPLKEYYTKNGWSTRLTAQFHSMLDDLALRGTENVGTLNSKLNSAFSKGKELAEKAEIYSGNKLAEEFNRFVSADSMRQITDLGVQAGKITEQEATSYINTFVNRTQGNILASQRPLVFQGSIGQAVGMFQSYQFNMMQQLFRHVAEGAPKDAAMLLGLQGTMYGMNGLPAFNFLNTHIVGTASGNPQHQDLYSATYGITGKSVGDMLLYGLPSNLLRANLYTRGDINPRQATVIPTNPADIPFINATTKLYDNVKGMMSNVANGASVWQSLLQGIEHNGLSRPLAGVAQAAQALTNGGTVFSTTTKGSISGANDLMAWGTAVRLAGGKPLDDAIGNDATYRYAVYAAADKDKMDSLSKAVRTSSIGSGPSIDSVNEFAEKYAALGGKQQNFNKYMIKQIKSANTSRANAIMENLKDPYNQKMQQIMGGTEGLDGRGFTE